MPRETLDAMRAEAEARWQTYLAKVRADLKERKIDPNLAHWANHKRRKDAEMAEYDRMVDFLLLHEIDPAKARELIADLPTHIRTHLLENATALAATLRAKGSSEALP